MSAAFERILALADEIQAQMLSTILEERGIPHLLHSQRDSAYSGLFQSATFWGYLEAPPEHRQTILAVAAELDHSATAHAEQETRIEALLEQMTREEKLGQMTQVSDTDAATDEQIRQGKVGSFLNVLEEKADHCQRLAVEESRLGIPLIFARDVIHGFRTIFPIPLGQAASFDPEGIRQAAAVAAHEASAAGVHWTFAPMIDVSRDPRWGRIAESAGEDPYLNAAVGVAMVRGFQGDDLADPRRIAACAKHYVGYGAAEGGRDYNSTWIPEGLLRDVYLSPFEACAQAGCATFMSGFNDLNGIPTSGHAHTIRQILKKEWNYDGLVVSDWASIAEMIPHGYCADEREAALKALAAGVDMEMVSTCFAAHGIALLEAGLVDEEWIDEAVRRILRLKFRLGLFDAPYRSAAPAAPTTLHLDLARRLARDSCVLLENDGLLPLAPPPRLAVVGPLADRPQDQLGCWVFDGVADDTITPLAALREALADRSQILYAPGMADCRSQAEDGFAEAVAAAQDADVAVAFVGEDALLSGEAHSRAFLDLPGAQPRLLEALVATGTPLAVVVLAGRPLEMGRVAQMANALLYAWHPGTMGGPAIADLLLGVDSPSGRLPATFPRSVGQVPLYYAKKNTGRPPAPDQRGAPMGTPLDPVDFTSGYLDVEHTPLYPFGYGLTYSSFEYGKLKLAKDRLGPEDTLEVSLTLRNTGSASATEVVQLYVRDHTASMTRPMRELKDFRRVTLAAGVGKKLSFALPVSALAFHNEAMQRIVEPGAFTVWVGPDAASGPEAAFEILPED